MTPTVFGRWQTRFFLLFTFGAIVTYIYASFMGNFRMLFIILSYVFFIGLAWDVLYYYLQHYRWDSDWPPVYQLIAGVVEGIFLWLLIAGLLPVQFLGLAGLPGIDVTLKANDFITHYSSVWIVTFLAAQSIMRIIFPRWRYMGGEWLK